MGKRSKVTNMLNEVFDHEIAGKRYTLKPGESMTLDRYEAVDVCGTYLGPNTKVSLKIEHLPDPDEGKPKAEARRMVFVSPDGKEHDSKGACDDWIRHLNKK